MHQSQLRPRAPRHRRVAAGLGVTITLVAAVAGIRMVAPTGAAAQPRPASAPASTTSTTPPSTTSDARPPWTFPLEAANDYISALDLPDTPTAPAVPAAPVSAPTASPAADFSDPVAQAEAMLAEVVPARWLAAVPVWFEIVGGTLSMSYTDGGISLTLYHLTGSRSHALSVIAHEWGHQVAYRYGTHAYLGAPPAGFPYDGPRAEEAWADCVATALTGIVDPSHGLAPCPGDALAFTATWLAAGP